MRVEFRDVLVLAVLAMFFIAFMTDKLPRESFVVLATSVLSFYFGVAFGYLRAVALARAYRVIARMFDDLWSVWHAVLGIALYFVAFDYPIIAVSGTAAYVAYELIDSRKDPEELWGDASEFAFGAWVGALARIIVALVASL